MSDAHDPTPQAPPKRRRGRPAGRTEDRTVSLSLSSELLERARGRADALGVSLSALVRSALEHALGRGEG